MLSCFGHVQLLATLWTVAHQAPLSMGILQARILEWVAMPSSWDGYYIAIDNKIKYRQNVSMVYLQYFEWAQGISGIKGSPGSFHLNILGDHY